MKQLYLLLRIENGIATYSSPNPQIRPPIDRTRTAYMSGVLDTQRQPLLGHGPHDVAREVVAAEPMRIPITSRTATRPNFVVSTTMPSPAVIWVETRTGTPQTELTSALLGSGAT